MFFLPFELENETVNFCQKFRGGLKPICFETAIAQKCSKMHPLQLLLPNERNLASNKFLTEFDMFASPALPALLRKCVLEGMPYEEEDCT